MQPFLSLVSCKPFISLAHALSLIPERMHPKKLPPLLSTDVHSIKRHSPLLPLDRKQQKAYARLGEQDKGAAPPLHHPPTIHSVFFSAPSREYSLDGTPLKESPPAEDSSQEQDLSPTGHKKGSLSDSGASDSPSPSTNHEHLRTYRLRALCGSRSRLH